MTPDARTNRVVPRVALGWIALLLTGCVQNNPNVIPPWAGPTQTMSEVVGEINGNNQEITSIWSQLSFEISVHDRKGNEHYLHDNGILLYRKPNDFLLQGKSIKGLLFEVGSSSGDDPQFWATVTEGEKTQWWGHYKNLGKPCVDIRQVPIRPDLLIEVLGVSDFNTNFLQQPVPVMKFNRDDGGFYLFTWSVQLSNRWVASKEVWYDRVTKLPRKVLLFDENGRILLRAALSEHEVLEDGNGKQVATKYDLFFPETRDKLSFKLLNQRVSKNGIPKPGSISRRDPGDDIRKVQIDENCP